MKSPMESRVISSSPRSALTESRRPSRRMSRSATAPCSSVLDHSMTRDKVTISKKAQFHFLTDLTLLVIFGVIAAVIFGLAQSGISQANQQTDHSISQFQFKHDAVISLRGQLNELHNLENVDLEQHIGNSKQLNGKIINSCLDYNNQDNCNQDPLQVGPKCIWQEKRCIYE